MHVPYSCKGFLLLPNSITEYLYPYYLRYDERFFNTKFAEVTQRSRRDFEIRHQTIQDIYRRKTFPAEPLVLYFYLYASSSHFGTISNEIPIVGNLRENSLKAECLFQT